jgi:DNA polymerase-3 subunit delta'
MRGRQQEAPPESDRFEPAAHPRETYDLFGHARAEAELLDSYRSGRLPQAWILGGPMGIGKATLAWRMARFLVAHPDPAAPQVLRAKNLAVDPEAPASRKLAALSFGDLALLRREWNDKTKKHFTRISVDDVRRVLHIFEQAAGEGGWRMVIIDSADDLNASSANALLKIIEEPPPNSLFLIVAQQPGRILPTIRSRCRRLMLQPLGEPDLQAATRAALQAAEIETDEARLASACARAGGAPREALRLLSAADAKFDALVDSTLALLPKIDWMRVHRIADGVAGDAIAYDAFVNAAFAWLSAALRGGASPRALAPYAEAWEKLERDARDLDIYNLDKRAFTLLTFALLAEKMLAARAARG